MTRAEFIDQVQELVEEVQLAAWGVLDGDPEPSPVEVALKIAALVPEGYFEPAGEDERGAA